MRESGRSDLDPIEETQLLKILPQRRLLLRIQAPVRQARGADIDAEHFHRGLRRAHVAARGERLNHPHGAHLLRARGDEITLLKGCDQAVVNRRREVERTPDRPRRAEPEGAEHHFVESKRNVERAVAERAAELIFHQVAAREFDARQIGNVIGHTDTVGSMTGCANCRCAGFASGWISGCGECTRSEHEGGDRYRYKFHVGTFIVSDMVMRATQRTDELHACKYHKHLGHDAAAFRKIPEHRELARAQTQKGLQLAHVHI